MNVQQTFESNPQLIELVEDVFRGLDGTHDALAVARRSLHALRAAVGGDE